MQFLPLHHKYTGRVRSGTDQYPSVHEYTGRVRSGTNHEYSGRVRAGTDQYPNVPARSIYGAVAKTARCEIAVGALGLHYLKSLLTDELGRPCVAALAPLLSVGFLEDQHN